MSVKADPFLKQDSLVLARLLGLPGGGPHSTLARASRAQTGGSRHGAVQQINEAGQIAASLNHGPFPSDK